ncbi:hypothetical protein GCM10027419_33070 [Pandoraea terrae]|nr:hypothetical protein [Pandoraea terrae]
MKKTDLEKLKGLKINSAVRRGPPVRSGQKSGTGASGPVRSKLLGALLGTADAPKTDDTSDNGK